MFDNYLNAFRNYADFHGRASRKEFWNFMLVNILSLVGLCIVDSVLTGGLLYSLYGLSVCIPCLAVCVRRLHDTGRSGWWYLFCFTGIGAFVVLVWLMQESSAGSNQYGPEPDGGNGGYIPDFPGRINGVPLSADQSGMLSVAGIAGSMYGRVYPVGSSEIVFGRSGSAWIHFPDNEPGISRIHCKLFYNQGRLMLVDCGSAYGTYLRGLGKLSPQQPVEVNRGSVFFLGSRKVGFKIQ